MEKLKNYVMLGMAITIAVLLMLSQCGSPPAVKEVYIKGKDSISYDTIKPPATIKYLPSKPYPKWDTARVVDTVWNADLCKFEREYNDSTSNDSITIYSKIKTIGIIKDMQLGYRWKVPTINKTVTRVDTIIKPTKWQFFAYTEVGGNIDKFNFSVGADLQYKKAEVGYRYGIVDQTHNIKVGYKFLGSKK